MSFYSTYNYNQMMPMYGNYARYHNPYTYNGGLYPAQQSYYYGSYSGGMGNGGFGSRYDSHYPYSNSYYGSAYRQQGLFRNMLNRLRYGSSSYYYPEMGYMGAGSGRWPYERDFGSTKSVWKRNGIY